MPPFDGKANDDSAVVRDIQSSQGHTAEQTPFPSTFQLDSTYKFELKAASGAADKVVANGVTINSGALFSFIDLGSGTLTQGTVFTAIDNTAATAISATFSNLPDGSTFTVGTNSYQVSYSGEDGNDLTLTVVP